MGMVNAVENYPWKTLWNRESAILGIHSARQLGIISEAELESLLYQSQNCSLINPT